HREIDDPAELEAVLLDQPELLAHARARGAGQLGRLVSVPGGEEAPVVGPEADRLVERLHALLAVVLGDRAAELAGLASDVAEPGVALGAGPLVHLVEELAALLGGRGGRNSAHHAARTDDLLEQAET